MGTLLHFTHEFYLLIVHTTSFLSKHPYSFTFLHAYLMTPSQIEALCDRKLPYYPTTTGSSKLLVFVPMLSSFILVRFGIVFLLLSKVKPFICASYPVCSHLPQGLWYFGYPNTIPASSCSSLLNPSCQ